MFSWRRKNGVNIKLRRPLRLVWPITMTTTIVLFKSFWSFFSVEFKSAATLAQQISVFKSAFCVNQRFHSIAVTCRRCNVMQYNNCTKSTQELYWSHSKWNVNWRVYKPFSNAFTTIWLFIKCTWTKIFYICGFEVKVKESTDWHIELKCIKPVTKWQAFSFSLWIRLAGKFQSFCRSLHFDSTDKRWRQKINTLITIFELELQSAI